MKKNIPFLLVYYMVFIIGYSIIKHFAGWSEHTFAQLDGAASNFVGSALAVMAEIILALLVGLIFLLASKKSEIGKFIIWSTATIIPVAVVLVITSHFVLDFLNNRLQTETEVKLQQEIIDRLPKDIFHKKSGGKTDFSGYVTIDNDSLGLITGDTGSMAKVYVYIDSAQVGNVALDSCAACSEALEKRLIAYIIPMQSVSSEEIEHNLKYVTNHQTFVADSAIYLGACRRPATRFIIINHVYDRVRHLRCYEIGFEVDCKTPPAHVLQLF